MFIKLKVIFLISVLSGAFGCALAGTPSQNRATQAENRQVYEIYQKYMQSQNQERELSGLPPKPIRSYEDWQKSPGAD
jgi:hypothetical protein